MSIDAIRARILADLPTHDYRLCLDPDMRKRIIDAAARVDALKAQQDKQVDDEAAPKRRTIGGKTLADQISDAEQALAKLDAEAVNAGLIVLLRWQRLPGDEPEALELVPWKLADIGELILREEFSEGRSVAALFIVREWLKQQR